MTTDEVHEALQQAADALEACDRTGHIVNAELMSDALTNARSALSRATQHPHPRCAGFDADGKAFACPNPPGTPWTPVWCPECDERRRARLTVQFDDLRASFGGQHPHLYGDTVPVEVTIPADLSHTGKERRAVKPIDACLAPAVEALNAMGVITRASCCGHGKDHGTIIIERVEPHAWGGHPSNWPPPSAEAPR